MKMIVEAQGAALGNKLKRPDGRAAYERPKDEAAESLRGLIKSIGDVQTTLGKLEGKNDKELISVMRTIVDQNASMIAALKTIAVSISAQAPCDYEFEIRDSSGKLLKTITAKEC